MVRIVCIENVSYLMKMMPFQFYGRMNEHHVHLCWYHHHDVIVFESNLNGFESDGNSNLFKDKKWVDDTAADTEGEKEA